MGHVRSIGTFKKSVVLDYGGRIMITGSVEIW